MEDNKDLGKLFKERFANAEAEPSTSLWSQIEETLDQKQKRRGFIWLWMGVLVLLIISPIVYFSTTSNDAPEHDQSSEAPSVSDIQQKNESPNDNNIAPFNTSKKENNSDDQNSDPAIKSKELNVSTEPNEPIIENPVVAKQRQSAKSNAQQKSRSNGSLIEANTNTKNRNDVSQPTPSQKSSAQKNTASEIDTDFRQPKNGLAKEANSDKTKDTAAHGIANNNAKNIPQKNESNLEKESKEQVTTDSIAKKNPAQKKPVQKNEIQEEKEKEEPIWRNWMLTIQAGPNVFGHLNNKSPFDSVLTSGQTKVGTSYSYGVLVNVPIGDKALFRFGYKRANLKSFTDRAISALNENGGPAILNSNAINRNGKPIGSAFWQSLGSSDVFRIDQEIIYQGIPIEFLYRLKEGKIKVDALVGLNAHLLGKSTITLKNENGSLEAGSAAYLKKFTLVPTAGMTFRYQLHENFSFDLEPTFQYQINAFENSFKNTHPLIITINIGATLKL